MGRTPRPVFLIRVFRVIVVWVAIDTPRKPSVGWRGDNHDMADRRDGTG